MKILTFLLSLFITIPAFSQERANIHGKILDQNNEPIPFATVSILDAAQGTVADAEGYYELFVPPGKYILEARAMGFQVETSMVNVTSNSSRTIDFRLAENRENLSEVEVFGNRYERPDKIEALTRLPLEPYNQIQSISIISEKLIEQQGNLTISEATKNVPGVYTFATYGNKRESMSSRGFRGIPILKNGVRVHSDFRGVGILTDMQGIDNIQVLKGTAAITQGVATDLGSPGGVINLVTKTPVYEFGGSASMRAGTFGLFRPTFDIYGPMNDKKNLAFRINGALETSDSFRDMVSSERFYLNPSFEWLVDDKSKLTLEMEYFDDSRTPDLGTVNLAPNDVAAIYDLPYDVFLGFDSDRSITQNTTFSIRFEREIADKLDLKAAFFNSDLKLDDKGASLGSAVEIDGETLYHIRNRGYSVSTRQDRNSVFQLDLVGDEITTGKIFHTFQAGIDYRISDFETSSRSVSNIDRVNVFEETDNTLPSNIEFGAARLGEARSNSMGFVLQDVISFNSWLKTFLGLRYSTTETITETETTSSDALNPLAGIIISPFKNVNIFGSYTNSSYPRTASRLDENGDPLGNERFDQIEAGLKTNWLDSRLRFNLTLFKINNRNINLPVYDENWVPTGFYQKGGNDERKGIEVELTGRILPNLEVITGYSYIDAKYKEHTSFVYNSAPLNTPKHTFNAYANYTFEEGTFQNLSLGGGAYYTGERPINDWSAGAVTHEGIVPNQKPFNVDAYTLVNLQAAYKITPNWDVRLLANNIFNEIGYNAYRTSYINQTDPQNFAAVLQYTF